MIQIWKNINVCYYNIDKKVPNQYYRKCKLIFIIKETVIPEVGPEEVLVEVKSAGLNFFDNYIRQGLGTDVAPPCVIGLECSGIVRDVGKDVSRVKCTERVIVHCPKGGAFSDYVVADQFRVVRIPDETDFDEAASLTINYLTAYFTLVEIGGLKNGSSVLIQSAAGGVGWAATQIAKLYKNVTVFGIASQHKHAEIRENGVDYALTYDQDLKKEIQSICPEGISIVLENLAGESFVKNQELLSPMGKIILIGAKNMINGEHRSLCKTISTWWKTKNVSPYDLITENRVVAGFHLNNLLVKTPQKFEDAWLKIVKFLSETKIRPRIDSVYSFEDIDKACMHMLERKNIGKIILRPQLDFVKEGDGRK